MAKDSIVMIIPREGGVEFARVQAFIEHVGPTGRTHKIADLDWFKALPTAQATNKVLGCPVVSRELDCDPNGTLWSCYSMAATNIILAPHLHNNSYWQVLHTESNFIDRYRTSG